MAEPSLNAPRSPAMPSLASRIPNDRFLPLPQQFTAAGDPRRVGVEIEYGGVDEVDSARIIAEVLGGTARQSGAHAHTVEGTRLGDVDVYLDTAYRSATGTIAEAALDLARDIVPVEIVAPPVAPDMLHHLEGLSAALAAAGAFCSRDGLLYGYGLHLNVEVASTSADHIRPLLRAFALLEDLLRAMDPIDPARRILPFVDPWPRSLLDRLAADAPDTVDGLITLFLDEAPSRNHALDPYCLFKHIDEDRIAKALPDASIKARPAWHYRLPDSRVAEEGHLAYEWNRWVMVETLAARGDLIDEFARDWARHRDALLTTRIDWSDHLADRLASESILAGETA